MDISSATSGLGFTVQCLHILYLPRVFGTERNNIGQLASTIQRMEPTVPA